MGQDKFPPPGESDEKLSHREYEDNLSLNVKANFLTENVSRTVIVIQSVISGSEFHTLHIFIVIPQVQVGTQQNLS